MLCEAAELEHEVMCQYLFAAFSLKQREDEGSRPGAGAVAGWRRVIAHVATEEMLHLALVQNVPRCDPRGASFHPAQPARAGAPYPAGVNLTLVPFGERALLATLADAAACLMAGVLKPLGDPLSKSECASPRARHFADWGAASRFAIGGEQKSGRFARTK